jgi:hypothetical protein
MKRLNQKLPQSPYNKIKRKCSKPCLTYAMLYTVVGIGAMPGAASNFNRSRVKMTELHRVDLNTICRK